MEDQLDPPRVLQDGENVLLLKANNVRFALTQLQQLVRLSHKSLATDTLLKNNPKLQDRFSQHRDYVKRDINTEPSGEHFNVTPGHSVSDMQGLVLEKIKSRDPFVLSARERLLILKFDSYRNGLNKQR